MLRLPATTISLTMQEVKDFENHRRFRNYLTREDARVVVSPARLVHSPLDFGYSDFGEESLEDSDMEDEEPPALDEHSSAGLLLSLRPKRLPKTGRSGEQPLSGASQSTSPSTEPDSSTDQPPNWTDLTPRPGHAFSARARVTSDEHSLPLSPMSNERASPVTPPPRRSSLMRDAETRPRNISGLLRSATRLVDPGIQRHRPDSAERDPPAAASPSPVVATPFRIYDDSLPPASQPQTPRHVPEARHQSRLRGSYTAPVTRMTTRSAARRRRDRAPSPSGLDTPGFRGLYGGRENSEDSELFHDAPQS